MIKKLVSHLGEYKRAAVLTPLFAALEAVMDVLLPTIMAFIIDQGIEKGDMNAILKYGLLTFLVAVVALALGVGFVPVRKPRKLPRETIAETYELEYGTDQLEIHVDAIKPGDKVLVVDDLLATGGTIDATVKLIRRLGGEVHDAAFIINLFDLGGEQRLEKLGIHCYSLVPFPGH